MSLNQTYLQVYEYDTECYRVVWEEPSGRRRYSQSCTTLNEAIERSARHDWPWVVVRETSSREVVEGNHDHAHNEV